MPSLEILRGAFGLDGFEVRRYELPVAQPASDTGAVYPQFPNLEPLDIGGNAITRHSWLGTPVFAPLTLRAGSNTIDLDNAITQVTQGMRMVRTEVQGRSGTVKEYYSADDYAVKIQGAIISQHMDYFPYDRVRFFRELLSTPGAIKAISDYLLLFDIYELAIENVEWIQQAGIQNTQLFEISGYSDSPEELLEYVGDV